MPPLETNKQTAAGSSAGGEAARSGSPPNLPRRDAGTEAQPASDAWQDVRKWRKSRREALVASRLAMTGQERTAHRTAVHPALRKLLGGESTRVLGFYWPFKGEFDPRPLVRELHASGTRLALPVVVEKARPLVFRAWWPGAPLVPGIWDIPVPASDQVIVPDTLLVPLVGFDENGFRLGYGGGYYDRTLAVLSPRPRTIAVGHEFSAMPTIHPQPYDIPMDVIVTEQRTRTFRG